MSRNLVLFALASASVFFLSMEDAHAYIDPGTGSMILQALLAGAVAAIAFGKQIYGYLRNLFHKDDAKGGGGTPETGDGE